MKQNVTNIPLKFFKVNIFLFRCKLIMLLKINKVLHWKWGELLVLENLPNSILQIFHSKLIWQLWSLKAKVTIDPLKINGKATPLRVNSVPLTLDQMFKWNLMGQISLKFNETTVPLKVELQLKLIVQFVSARQWFHWKSMVLAFHCWKLSPLNVNGTFLRIQSDLYSIQR